jgi:hypothetical protein
MQEGRGFEQGKSHEADEVRKALIEQSNAINEGLFRWNALEVTNGRKGDNAEIDAATVLNRAVAHILQGEPLTGGTVYSKMQEAARLMGLEVVEKRQSVAEGTERSREDEIREKLTDEDMEWLQEHGLRWNE